MEFLHGLINDINGFIWTYIIIWALIGLGVYFTLRTGLVQLRMLPESIRRGRDSSSPSVSMWILGSSAPPPHSRSF